jgi:uncharacterized protein YggE
MTMNMTPLAAALAAALIAAPAMAQALPDARFATTTLDVSGHGEAHVKPDMARISLGVTDTAPTAADASQQNAAAMTRVVAALKAGGIADADIQTSGLSLSAQYAYATGQAPRLTGYQASNNVTVTVKDLTRLGPALDAATGAGATNVGGVSFSLQNPAAAANYARLAAVQDLEQRAHALADAAGYHIVRLINLREGAGAAPPAPRVMMAMAAPTQSQTVTPVEAGEIALSVDVSGEFELGH